MVFRLFERAVSPFPADEPIQPPAKLFAFIWHYARPFGWLMALGMIATIGVAVVEVFAFGLVGEIVDWMTATGQAGFWDAHGGKIVAICLMVAVLWPALTLVEDLVIVQGLLGNMAMQIRWRGHRYLLGQSSDFFANDFAGRITTKLMQTAGGVRETCLKLMNIVVYMTVYFVMVIVLFAQNDLRLILPVLIWLALYAATMAVFLPRLQRWSEKQSDARSALTGRIVDAYTNIGTVKMFSSKKAEERYAREGMEGMLATVYPQMRIVTGMSFSLNFINGLFIAGVIAVGTWLWTLGSISTGTLAFASAMALRIQGISHYFLWEMSALFENIGAAQDGMTTIAKPRSVLDAEEAEPIALSKGRIEFDRISFHYGGQRKVLKDLSLTIAPGEKLGIVGRSGAGKSTLVSLLLRMHDLEGGQIRIDGQDISRVTQESLRSQIAVVSQDTSLLHRSIRDNIAYGKPGATEADIIAAAKAASAHDFILGAKDKKGREGYDAHVGERGVKLSGGQRQRIAVARVILKNAPILVLDEATSALDSEVEAAIQEQLGNLMGGKTVLAIAHRLSTIAAMDRLIVMDQGQIVEEGTHEALIAEGGIYAELWARQSGGFLNEGVAAAE